MEVIIVECAGGSQSKNKQFSLSLILLYCYLAFLAKAKLVINPYNIHVLYNLVYRIGMFIIWKRRILLFLNKLVGFFLTMLMLLCLHLVYFVVVIVD